MTASDMTASSVTAWNTTIDAPIVFIGGGNMVRSLIGGLLTRGAPVAALRVVEPIEAARSALARDFGVQVFEDATDAIDGAAIWMMAVKPDVMRAVCEALATHAVRQHPLVLSIAAGITTAQLARWLSPSSYRSASLAIVRCMPNTPALLGAGITGLFANAKVDAEGRARAESLLAGTGATVWLEDEALMDAVTGISGSGPAYVFLLAEAMEQAALAEGLPLATARILVERTLLGAARMLCETGESAGALRARVTSPGGTTQSAIEAFERGGLRALVAQAVHAATTRGAQLSSAND